MFLIGIYSVMRQLQMTSVLTITESILDCVIVYLICVMFLNLYIIKDVYGDISSEQMSLWNLIGVVNILIL